MATVFQPLHATRIDRRRVTQVAQPPNLLLSTLFVATIASSLVPAPERIERPQPEAISAFRALLEVSPTPDFETEHPNPVERRPDYAVDPLGTPRILFAVAAAPFTPTDVSSYEFIASVQSDERPSASLSLAQNEAAAFSQSDWLVPQRKIDLDVGFARDSLLSTLLEVEDVTHRLPTYAPRPHRGQHTVYSGTEQSSFHALIAPLAAVPFTQAEWPVVPRQERIEAHTIFVVSYESGLPDPFGQRDWLTPPRKRAIDLSYHANISTALLFETVVLPFDLTEWPVVPKIERFQQTPQPNLQGLLYVVPAKPFAQNDWPTPPRRVGRFDFNLTNLIGTIAPPPIPFNKTDWPNPLRKTDPHFDVWGQSLQHTTLFVENVKPFNQNDWNFGYLFDDRPVAPQFTLSSKLVTEGFGLIGLQPAHNVVGLMTTHGVSVFARITLHGLSVEGLMTATQAVDGTFEEGEGHEGSFL